MALVRITAVLWVAFAGFWLLASQRTERITFGALLASIRPIWLVADVLNPALYYLPLSSVPVLGWRIVPTEMLVGVIGACLLILGLCFAVWARCALASNWSGAVILKPNHTLTTSGPYRIVRHPIYLGVLCAMLGSALVIGEMRAFLRFIGVCAVWKQKITAEETLLDFAFSDEYARYKKQVGRLLPRISVRAGKGCCSH
jgi:protein-S-isoprenylcysteine O-methyltransferase Ste14